MKTKRLLFFYLAVMAALIVYALLSPDTFESLVRKPQFYLHAKFIHILAVTLFFANGVIGTLWEVRSLVTGTPDIIRYTYKTVSWLDAIFTAPLIIVSVLSGIMLGTILGGVWTIGWVSIAFTLFLASGLVWIIADIPTQYRVNKLFETVAPGAAALPANLRKLLWWRMAVNAMGVIPLLVIFFLMVHKPDLPKISTWFHKSPARVAAF